MNQALAEVTKCILLIGSMKTLRPFQIGAKPDTQDSQTTAIFRQAAFFQTPSAFQLKLQFLNLPSLDLSVPLAPVEGICVSG